MRGGTLTDEVFRIAENIGFDKDGTLHELEKSDPDKELEDALDGVVKGLLEEIIGSGHCEVWRIKNSIKKVLGWQSFLLLEMLFETMEEDDRSQWYDGYIGDPTLSIAISLLLAIKESCNRIDKERTADKAAIKALTEALNTVKEEE